MHGKDQNYSGLETRVAEKDERIRYWIDCYETALSQVSEFPDTRLQITESALLNKAGRLAAEQHLILKDKSMSDSSQNDETDGSRTRSIRVYSQTISKGLQKISNTSKLSWV